MSKLNMQVAMMEYHDELKRLSELEAISSIDPLWNNWYRLAFMYEPSMQEKLQVDEPSTVVIFSPPTQKDRKYKHRIRRRATFSHKHKLQMTAVIVGSNYCKRSEEDMRFAKRRIAGEVVFSKSRTMKSDRIIKQAEKIKKSR